MVNDIKLRKKYIAEVSMKNNDYQWALGVAEKIYEKSKASANRSVDKVPYLTENGIFDDWSDRISWWTNVAVVSCVW